MKFTDLPEFLEYSDFRIEEKIGKHTVCSVVLKIDPDKAEDFLSAAEQRKSIEVSSDSGERVINGIVSAVAVNYGVTLTTAEVTITSESLLLQEKGEERIFQNPKKTYADILKEYPEVEKGKCEHLNDTVEEIIYQHNMDDFTFLLYLAGRCGCGIWITEDGKVSFGMINHTKTMSDTEKVYQKSVIEKKITAEKSGRKIEILTMEQFPNGSTLKHGQTDYTVCEVYVSEKCDETYFRYTGLEKPDYKNTGLTLATLVTKAKVTDNKDPENLGRIKVDFTGFSDKDSEKTWIPYLSNFTGKNNGGIVMLPDAGNEVVVCISDGVPYAVNSLRSSPLPENCRDVDKKHLAVKDSIITVDEQKITAKQGDKSTVVMTKDSIVSEHDKSKMTIDADKIRSENDKSSLTLKSDSITAENGKSLLTMKSDSITAENDKSSLTMKSDSITAENSKGRLLIESKKSVLTGGKSQLSLDNGKTVLSGSKIDLSTQGVSS